MGFSKVVISRLGTGFPEACADIEGELHVLTFKGGTGVAETRTSESENVACQYQHLHPLATAPAFPPVVGGIRDMIFNTALVLTIGPYEQKVQCVTVDISSEKVVFLIDSEPAST